MSKLDNLIAWASPKWAYERSAYRMALNSYKGGVATRTSELWSSANGFRFGTTAERQSIVDACSRAYSAYDNNPVAKTLMDTETDNVIGDGLNYQPTTDDEGWNREAKDRYYEWLEDCSVRGGDVETGCEVQRQLWQDSRVAGDIGWILVSRGTPDRLESRIQIVRAENIVTPDGKYSDRNIFNGIRFDAWGKPTAFYVLTTDEYGKRDFATIEARDFVYLPHSTKSNQARPPSCYITIFDYLAHLDRYVDGVSLAAWMATVFGIVFKKNNAARQLSNLPLLTNSQGDQQKAITFENGSVKFVGTDEEVAQVQATQPMQQTPEFIRTMFRMIGQPFGMPLEVVALDMSTCNFASARIGLLPFYRKCRIKAGRFGSRWSRTIRWWLSRERLRSNDDPKKWVSAFPADYWNHELLLNEWSYTDPISEAQSDQLQIDMGTKSVQAVIAERGRDAEQILRERREWMEKTKELPQTHSTLTRDPAPEPVEPQPDKPNKDEDNDEPATGTSAGD